MFRLGVIGLGNRIYGGVLSALYERSKDWKVTAVCDIDVDSVKQKIADKPQYFSDDVKTYTDADEILANEQFDGIVIGTRCSTHTDIAIKAMAKKVPIFLEKPVCTNMEDLHRLNEARKKYNPQVLVSFPLRYTDLAILTKEIIDSGRIGEVLQVDAYNDVPYGRVYYHSWYRDENETGGLWLQKATHDFDYLNYILGDSVEEIFAHYVRKLFKGDVPAGMTCDLCEKAGTCPESPDMVKNIYRDESFGPYCCFAEDTGNEDCGSALLKRKSGAIVTYSQNFFARHEAARRGARFYGYKGTVEFDWYKGEVKVYMHTAPRVETYTYKDDGTHFGGDTKMAKEYLQMLNGESNVSYLKDGIESALICMMAKESCETGKNMKVMEL
ncbi:MAG: Gfo/Idh/MocA family oxidoreductase [Clostridia bacterium]|nr:Gfo/Idh/MocA family oxidoreductase [Clostridia bacterium]